VLSQMNHCHFCFDMNLLAGTDLGVLSHWLAPAESLAGVRQKADHFFASAN
jgi:hypothetical protein